MPRPARPWFRFYVEAMRDPKMRRLTPAQRWLWVAILSAARESHRPGYLYIAENCPMEWADLADYAGMKLKDVEVGTDAMHAYGMLAYDADLDAWWLPAWSERQYESDDVTSRTRKHRSQEHGRNVPKAELGTPPETEAETDIQDPPNPHSVGAQRSRVIGANPRAQGTNPRAQNVAAVLGEGQLPGCRVEGCVGGWIDTGDYETRCACNTEAIA